MNILVTGGNGFIGSNFIKKLILHNKFQKIINLDKCTYSGSSFNIDNLDKTKYLDIKGDICNRDLIFNTLKNYSIDIIVNFAAETHVDRSIINADQFIETNIQGTYSLLSQSLKYLNLFPKKNFKFIHISTDEVYGSLKPNDNSFTEENPYLPNSPYAASKASSDLLVRSYIQTYGLPAIITNCSNNYGPYQYPEKLIPLVILNCLQNKPIPIYGNGLQIRDWIYVEDHCDAIIKIIDRGILGEKYNIGGNSEYSNIEIVKIICAFLDRLFSKKNHKHENLITFVKDRPGHDTRYAINNKKIYKEIGWSPSTNFNEGIIKTINWYIKNIHWVKNLDQSELYKWSELNYINRH